MSDEIIPRGSTAAETRSNAQRMRAEAEEQSQAIARHEGEVRAELEAAKKALEVEFQRKMADLQKQMEPLKERLAQLREIAWTVDLYLGRDESITQIREGAPASEGTPIAIRQRVLSMAEESLIYLDGRTSSSRGMGADDIQKFIDWIVADDDNLARILPEPKGVVVLVPTTIRSDASDDFRRAAENAANEQGYWLIRNGENLYVLTTDENMILRERILPRRDEFVSVFEKRLFNGDIAPVEPGSAEWLEMEKRANARQRHYMRALLVLQGLVDRTTVWHPLPEDGVNFMTLQSQDDGKIALVQDEDPARLLGDGRESFLEFRGRLNARLRPGMRVIVSTSSNEFRYFADEGWPRRHSRLSPETANYPESLTPYVIEGRRHGGFVIRYERTDEVFRQDKWGGTFAKAERRASLLLYPHDSWVLPMDLASEAELRYFLHSRENRSRDLLEMVPLIHAALEVKEAEKAEEAPFREFLATQLGAEDLDVNVDDLIHAWKTRNIYARALNGDAKHEAKAAREIMREARHHAKAATEASRMVERARRLVPDATAVAYRATSTPGWVALVPSEPGSLFHDIYPLRSRKEEIGTVEHEVFAGHSLTSRLIVHWSTEAWEDVLTSSVQEGQVLSPSQEQSAMDAAHALAAAKRPGRAPLAITRKFDRDNPQKGWEFRICWFTDEDSARRDGLRVSDDKPFVFEQVTVTRDLRTGNLSFRTDDSNRLFPSYHSKGIGSHLTPWVVGEGSRDHDRHVLVWSDAEQMERLRTWRTERDAESERLRADRERRQAEITRWTDHIEQAVRQTLEEREWARFLEDMGPGHDHLWEGHLKSRSKSRSMMPPWGERLHVVREAVRDRLGQSEHLDLEGVTLGDLLPRHSEGFADWVVPALPEPKEGVASGE